jgi:hypothetical protein
MVNQIQASDSWLCTEESSQRRDDVISSCGIGVASDENQARAKAFDNAKAEFDRICNPSADCKDHEITIEPKRTSCMKTKTGKVKCYRLVAFTVGNAKVAPTPSPEAKNTKTELIGPTAAPETGVETRRFVGKMRKGLTKTEVLHFFGKPDDVTEESDGLVMRYENWSFCKRQEISQNCYVHIDRHDLVSRFLEFRFEFTNLLDPKPFRPEKKGNGAVASEADSLFEAGEKIEEFPTDRNEDLGARFAREPDLSGSDNAACGKRPLPGPRCRIGNCIKDRWELICD